jgi:threonine/homoserine/homoserine lactone efflux protein
VENLGLTLSAFGLGAALGALPGPVQFVLLTEASRGGLRRGFTAMAGANGTFGLMLLALAAGLSFAAPSGTALRVLKVVGGVFLLLVAADAIRSLRSSATDSPHHRGAGPAVKGILAVLLNPGAYLFLATTASALFADGARRGGRPLALLLAVTMMVGLAIVDGSFVLLAGGGRRLGARVAAILTPLFALGLAGFGGFLVVQGLRP